MEVIKIVYIYLKDNKYDGLYNPGLCACELGDLAPCGEIQGNCIAGYKTYGLKMTCKCEFHIGSKKNDYECGI